MADDESGLLAYPKRLYSPGQGRWFGRDPEGEEAGINLYGFVSNEPLTSIDPVGAFTLVEEEVSAGIEGNLMADALSAGRQMWSLYNRVRDAVDTYNEIQEFLSGASDILDEFDDGDGATFTAMLSMGSSSFAQGLRKNKRPTHLYDKLGAKGEHLKYGITVDLDRRYSARELGGGRLKVLAKGKRKAMLALERALHKTLPIGPEEGQRIYWLIQKLKGYTNP